MASFSTAESEPKPIDMSRVVLPKDQLRLMGRLGENTPDHWVWPCDAHGWTFGSQRSDVMKQHLELVLDRVALGFADIVLLGSARGASRSASAHSPSSESAASDGCR